MNERLDDLRRELAREAHDHDAKDAIKGLRWLLLHRPDDLEKDAARRLKRSRALNEPLQCTYLLKEELGVAMPRGPELYKTGLTSGKMEGINRKIRGLLSSGCDP
jgi:hypothetical protein